MEEIVVFNYYDTVLFSHFFLNFCYWEENRVDSCFVRCVLCLYIMLICNCISIYKKKSWSPRPQ